MKFQQGAAVKSAVLPVSAGDVIKSDLLGRGRNEGGAGGTGLRSSEDSAFEEGNFTARTGKCGSRVRRERVDLIACMDIDEAAAAEIFLKLRFQRRCLRKNTRGEDDPRQGLPLT